MILNVAKEVEELKNNAKLKEKYPLLFSPKLYHLKLVSFTPNRFQDKIYFDNEEISLAIQRMRAKKNAKFKKEEEFRHEMIDSTYNEKYMNYDYAEPNYKDDYFEYMKRSTCLINKVADKAQNVKHKSKVLKPALNKELKSNQRSASTKQNQEPPLVGHKKVKFIITKSRSMNMRCHSAQSKELPKVDRIEVSHKHPKDKTKVLYPDYKILKLKVYDYNKSQVDIFNKIVAPVSESKFYNKIGGFDNFIKLKKKYL